MRNHPSDFSITEFQASTEGKTDSSHNCNSCKINCCSSVALGANRCRDFINCGSCACKCSVRHSSHCRNSSSLSILGKLRALQCTIIMEIAAHPENPDENQSIRAHRHCAQLQRELDHYYPKTHRIIALPDRSFS